MSAPLVLLTGGAGYIGSHTALAFLEAGWRVLIVDNLSTGMSERVPPDAELVVADCADPSMVSLIRDRGVDVAVHFAARVKVNESVSDPGAYYEANSVTALRFFLLAAEAGLARLVFSSTAAVYGTGLDGPVSEQSTVAPESPYGRSKLMSEWMLADLSAASSLHYVILRYFNVAGADPKGRSGPSPDAEHLVKLACEAAIGARPGLVIHGTDYPTPDGTCVRDYIHVSDLADAHVLAARHLLGGGESLLLNYGYGHGASVREVIDRALALARRPFLVSEGPRRAGDPASTVADARLLRYRLGWQPRHDDLESIIRSGMDFAAARHRKI